MTENDQDGSADDDWYLYRGDGSIQDKTVIHIRVDTHYLDGDVMTHIPREAFRRCLQIRHVQMPESITWIGDQAFCYCLDLMTLEFRALADDGRSGADEETPRNQILELGRRVFQHCQSLQSMTLPPSLQHLPEATFLQCHNLVRIVLPPNLISIGPSALSGCASLSLLEMPDSVKSLGDHAMAGCRALTRVRLSQNLQQIGHGAFWNCTALEFIELPGSAHTLGHRAWEGCRSLREIVMLHETTTSNQQPTLTIGNAAFAHCTSLQRVKIPHSTGKVVVGHDAFRQCEVLTSLYTPQASQVILLRGALEGCTSLSQLTLSQATRVELWNRALSDCQNMTLVALPRVIHLTVGDGTFRDCTSLKRLQLSPCMEYFKLGEDPFRGCRALVSVEFSWRLTVLSLWPHFLERLGSDRGLFRHLLPSPQYDVATGPSTIANRERRFPRLKETTQGVYSFLQQNAELMAELAALNSQRIQQQRAQRSDTITQGFSWASSAALSLLSCWIYNQVQSYCSYHIPVALPDAEHGQSLSL